MSSYKYWRGWNLTNAPISLTDPELRDGLDRRHKMGLIVVALGTPGVHHRLHSDPSMVWRRKGIDCSKTVVALCLKQGKTGAGFFKFDLFARSVETRQAA